MSGPMVSADYVSDDGTTYRTRIPQWVATLTGATTPATAGASLPKGYRPRRRYLRNDATGRDHAIVVCNPASTIYTGAVGTAETIPVFGAATPGAPNFTLSGRTGERDKAL